MLGVEDYCVIEFRFGVNARSVGTMLPRSTLEFVAEVCKETVDMCGARGAPDLGLVFAEDGDVIDR